MLSFIATHLFPTWKPHSSTCKDEIGNLYGMCTIFYDRSRCNNEHN
jgi:hypothetical protein